MTTTIERAGGFADIQGYRFGDHGKITVVGFAGRTPSPRWHVRCACGSSWIELHKTLVDAGSAYRCKNNSCAKGLQPQKQPQHIERDPAPTPAQAKSVQQRQYELYRRYMEDQGFGVTDIATSDEWARLREENRKKLLEPALLHEAAKVREQELRALGLAVEGQEMTRFTRAYGEV
jgi:hypothetical protein